jgi:hypothetical protein
MTGRQTDTGAGQGAGQGAGRTPPVAGFGWAPADASTHDTIRFYDYSFDPGQQGIATRRWDFGDGTGSDEARPEHRYVTDGAYTVTLTALTVDGRSCSHAVSLRVRTRHVSITSFTAPDRCGWGQQVDVTIGITSAQVDEVVDVVLLKRRSGREPAPVEQLSRATVVVRGGSCDGETPVTIPVVFPAADVEAGSITLEARVSVLAARDPSPSGDSAFAVVHVTASAPPSATHW